jgi:hypothetical protein
MSSQPGIVQALLIERIGYERRGLRDRVALVDQQLAALGIAVESAALDPIEETATRKKPSRRRMV